MVQLQPLIGGNLQKTNFNCTISLIVFQTAAIIWKYRCKYYLESLWSLVLNGVMYLGDLHTDGSFTAGLMAYSQLSGLETMVCFIASWIERWLTVRWGWRWLVKMRLN